MKILLNCEESQTVTRAFREKGYEAYSCDLELCSGGHPEWHIQDDAIMTKFNVGDKVRIVNYGSISMQRGDLQEITRSKVITEMESGWFMVDDHPELVGKIGIVSSVRESPIIGENAYALEGIDGKHAWYIEEQLELVNKNPNVL